MRFGHFWMALVDHRETSLCNLPKAVGHPKSGGLVKPIEKVGELQKGWGLGMGRWFGSDQSCQTPPTRWHHDFQQTVQPSLAGPFSTRNLLEELHRAGAPTTHFGGLPWRVSCQTGPHAPSTSWPRTPPHNQDGQLVLENFEPLDLGLQRLVSTPNDSFWVFQPCSCCQLVHPSGSPSAPVSHFSFPMVDVDASMVEQAPSQDVMHVRDPLWFTNDIDVVKEGKQTFPLHQQVLDCR